MGLSHRFNACEFYYEIQTQSTELIPQRYSSMFYHGLQCDLFGNLFGSPRPSSTFTGSETAANLNSSNAKTVTVKAKWKANDPPIPVGACTGSYGRQVNVNLAVNRTQDFDYRGSVDCAYLQKTGYYKLEVWGAQGGPTNQTQSAGYGGYAFGKVYISSATALYTVVGGRQKLYNGGNQWSNPGSDYEISGGATHISVQNCGELKNCSSYKGTYDSNKGTYDGGKILIVAGAGGSGYEHDSLYFNSLWGGNGGGYIGGKSSGYGTVAGGGSQSSGGTKATTGSFTSEQGAFGIGGAGANAGGGGGGGWFGGGGGAHSCSNSQHTNGGGGGSGYIGNSLLLQDKGMYMHSIGCTSSTAAATKTTCTSSTGAHQANKANTGNGYARITYLGT